MTRFAIVAMGWAALVCCGRTAPQAVPAPPRVVSEPAPADAGVVAAADAEAQADAAPALQPPAPPPAPPPPAPVPRTGKTWPFHDWDRAEAVLFNQFPMQRAQLRAYDDGGWSEHVADRKPIELPLAREAVGLVRKTSGGVGVSKCPFPRHAVVLYAGDTPVASINVCFECGDILLWPRWAPEPDWDAMTDRDHKRRARQLRKQMKAYDRVFPRWQSLFRDDVGYPIDTVHR